MNLLRNAEKIAEYKKVFLSFDKDNDCKITLHSLKTILEQFTEVRFASFFSDGFITYCHSRVENILEDSHLQ